MTIVSPPVAAHRPPTVLGPELTRRALDLALSNTTDMAEEVLRVPLSYYNDDKLADLEESTILRRVPIPVLASAQITITAARDRKSVV